MTKYLRILLASLVFGTLMGLFAAVTYAIVYLVLTLIGSSLSLGFVTFTAAIVFFSWWLSCFLAFLLSGVVKEVRKYNIPRWEGYVFLMLAAIPFLIYFSRKSLLLDVVLLISSTITVYFGEKFYRMIWKTTMKMNGTAYLH